MSKFQIDLGVGNRFWTPKGLGAMGMEPSQAIAELVANSLDWRSNEANIISIIQVFVSNNSIEIVDNGIGMTAQELQNAIQVSVANDTLRPNLRLRKGMFGMGMKVACLSLGWNLSINTRSANEKNIEHSFSLQARMLDVDGLTNEYRDNIEGESTKFNFKGPLGEIKSGTSILIEDLNYRSLTAIAIRDSLQEIFSPEISVENVRISVIDKVSGAEYKCEKIEIPIYPESKIEIDDLNLFVKDEVTGKPVQIRGWLGLMKTSSSGLGKWGLHLFKNKQVIERFHQLPSRLGGLMPKNPHPKFGRTYGEIHLDMCVPSFHKVGFDYSRDSWKQAVEVLTPSISTIMQKASDFRLKDYSNTIDSIRKGQKSKRIIKKALSNLTTINSQREQSESIKNSINLPNGDVIIIVEPIIDKLGKKGNNRSWIYYYREASKELAIVINEDSPVFQNLVSGDSDDKTFSLLISWAISDCILMLLCEQFHFQFRDAISFRDEQLTWLTSVNGINYVG